MTRFLIISTISMVVLLAVYYLLLQREKMHRFNRFYLLGAIVFSLAIPFVTITIYKEIPAVTAKPIIKTPEAFAQQEQQTFTPRPTEDFSHKTFAYNINYRLISLWSIYVLGVIIFLLRFIINITSLYRLIRQNEKLTHQGKALVLLNDCKMPYTFMHYIFVCKKEYANKTIEPELLAHEITHVRQRHTLDILFVEAVKTVFWFNPFLYAFKNAIQLNHEFLADEKTINQFNNIPTYQQMLLDKALPQTNHLLASSINFSITKKRFVMMTKTTSPLKGIVLKTAIVPVATVLLYFLSTETVVHAKNRDTVTGTVLSKNTALEKITPQTPNIKTITYTHTDTLVGDSRRDEYFKGVRIVIDDQLRGVHVNMPYEKLASEHKHFYLNDVPEKKVIKPISNEDYDFSLNHDPEHSIYYIDEKKVSRDEVLKYKREDFVSAGFKATGTFKPGQALIQQFQMFLFTKPFYEKNIKHLNDHYPDTVYTINITNKPVDTYTEGLEEQNKRDANGKTAYQREEDEQAEKLKAEHYNYVSQYIETNKNTSAQFPGGNDEFYAYLDKNIKLPATYKDKKIYVSYAINTDGTLTDVSVNDVDEVTEKEIIKVVEASPKWIPAQKNGKAVKISSNHRLNSK